MPRLMLFNRVRLVSSRFFLRVLITTILITLYLMKRTDHSVTTPTHESFVDQCEFASSQQQDVRCDPLRHKGPYIFIKRPRYGFFNQYMHLVAMLYLVQNFSGTIVFPANVTTRRVFADFHDTEWIPASSAIFFDIPYLVGYWKRHNVTVCLESQKVRHDSTAIEVMDFCTDFVPKPKIQVPYDRCNCADRLALTPYNFTTFVIAELAKQHKKLKSNVGVAIEPFWGILPLAEKYKGLDDPLLKVVQMSTFSLRVSQRIACAAQAIYHRIKRAHHHRIPIVGIHARLEKDWEHRTSNVPKSHTVLNAFEEGIRKLHLRYTAAYIAVGDMDEPRKQQLQSWANRNFAHRWHTKQEFARGLRLDELPREALATLEASVLIHMDHFIGQAMSSFDTFVCEIRTLMQKPSFLIYDFQAQFRPFVTLRRCRNDIVPLADV